MLSARSARARVSGNSRPFQLLGCSALSNQISTFLFRVRCILAQPRKSPKIDPCGQRIDRFAGVKTLTRCSTSGSGYGSAPRSTRLH